MFFQKGAIVERALTTATSGGTLTLLNDAETYQIFTGSLSHTLKLPAANTMPAGRRFEVINESTGTITVQDNGLNTLATLNANESKIFRLTDNSTANGVYDVTAASSGGAGLSSAESQSIFASGAGSNSEVSKSISFNPEEVGANYWLSKASHLTGKANPAAFAINGYMYENGGTVAGVNSLTTHRYDDDNNYWLNRASSTVSGYQPCGFALTKGYRVSGHDGTNYVLGIEAYTDSTNTWASGPNAPGAKSNSAGFATSNFGYFVTGYETTFFSTSNYAFNETNNAWSTRAPFPVARTTARGDVLNGLGYVVGGMDSGNIAQSHVYKYNEELNSWSSVKALSAARRYAAVFAASGRLYAATGDDGTTVTSRLDEYLDSSNTWLSRSTVGAARRELPTGKTALNHAGYIVAGHNGTSYISTVERYSNTSFINVSLNKKSNTLPTSIFVSAKLANLTASVPVQVRTDGNTWKNLEANKDSALKSGEVLKSKFKERSLVFATGGVSSANYFYSEDSNTWITKAAMSVSKFSAGAWSLEGFGYIYGGGPGTFPGVQTGEKYNDITNVWAAIASFTSTGRAYMQGFTSNGFGYSSPGSSDSTAIQNEFDRYDPSANSWITRAILNVSKFGPFMFSLNGGGYAAGGRTGVNTDTTGTEYYDTALNTWVTKGALTTSKYTGGACAGFRLNDFGFAPVGQVTNTHTADHQRYDSQNNVWSNRTAATTARRSAASQAAGGFGYVYGGGNGADLATNEQVNDESNAWTTKANMPTATSSLMSIGAGTYRNYEVKVGIPSHIAGLGGGAWLTKANLITSRSGNGTWGLNGFLYASTGTGVTTEKYSEDSNVWTLYVDHPFRRYEFAVFSLYGKGYAVSGYSFATSAVTTSTQYLDDVTASWITKANTTAAYQGTSGFALNGFGYKIGGSGSAGYFEQYNPISDAWASKATSYTTYGPAPWSVDGFGFSSGGQNGAPVATGQKYNDAANTWSGIANYPIALYFMDAFVVNGSGFVFGGWNGTSAQSTNYEYKHALNAWVQKPSLSAARYSNGDAGASLNGSGYFAGGQPSDATEQYVNSLNKIVLSLGLKTD